MFAGMQIEKQKAIFKKELLRFKKTGYRSFPWRDTHDPYHILVSEIMLQQTQADRVVPFYKNFLKRFKTVHALARAPLKDVLTLWSGLGYNRRARFLHEAAKRIVEVYKGDTPSTYEALRTLPGVGHYTAAAVLTFAYNEKMVVLETNIRTVLIHYFFSSKHNVPEGELEKVLTKLLPKSGFKEWYGLLMDFGAHLKKAVGNKNKQSRVYQKQGSFKGSRREVRGLVPKLLLGGALAPRTLYKQVKEKIGVAKFDTETICKELLQEGLIQKKESKFML
jgi:A/G-specific adenine glycosylase